MVPTDIRQKAYSLDLGTWIENLDIWEGDLQRGREWTPGKWYLTDMRHTHNIASPKMLGYLDEDLPKTVYDRIVELGDDILEWVEDHFGSEDDVEE